MCFVVITLKSYPQRRPKPDSRVKDTPDEKESTPNDTGSESKEIDPAHREGTATTTSSDKPKSNEPSSSGGGGKGAGGGQGEHKPAKESRRRKKNKDKGEHKSPDNRDAVKQAETVD